MSHELRRSLASYVFGALAPEERREVDEHLAGCPDCRDELASYAGVPGLLSRLELSEAVGATLLPPPSLLPSVLAAVESERTNRTRQVTRWRFAAAGTAAAAAVLVAVFTLTQDSPAPAPPPVAQRTLVAAAGVASSGSVSVTPKPWGTEMHLNLADLPAAEGYAAYTIDADGMRTLASTWGPTPPGQIVVPAATSLTPEALTGLVIETTEGEELLTLPSP